MRLIDADKSSDCKDCIIRAYCDCAESTERFGGECIVELILKNQPTAYDVDKVIEELNYIEMKWDKTCPPPNEYGEPMCSVDCVECQIRRCKGVVKGGGINDCIKR